MYKKHISGLVSTCTGDTAYLLDILQEHYDPWDLPWEKLGGFTIANVDPSGRDKVDLLDQRTADILVVLGVSENGGYTR